MLKPILMSNFSFEIRGDFLRKLILFFLFLLITSISTTAISSNTTTVSPEAEVLVLSTGDSIKLDGFLDEAFWKDAPPIGSFRQVDPIENGEPSEQTEVRVLATTNAVYFGIICYESLPDKITSFTMKTLQ